MKKSLIEKEKTGLEMFGAMVNVHSLQGTTTKPKKKVPVLVRLVICLKGSKVHLDLGIV